MHVGCNGLCRTRVRCRSSLPLQPRASVGFHQTRAGAEPQSLLCGLNSALQYGAADQQTNLTGCLRICPGTGEASLGSRFPSEKGIGCSSLLDAAPMRADAALLCALGEELKARCCHPHTAPGRAARTRTRTHAASGAEPHPGRLAGTQLLQWQQRCANVRPSLRAVERREEEAEECGKTQADVGPTLQSLEAELPACQLLSEATWMPG